MATASKRPQQCEKQNFPLISEIPKPNFWEKLCQRICFGLQSYPTMTEFPTAMKEPSKVTAWISPDEKQNGVASHYDTSKNGGKYEGLGARVKYKSIDEQAYGLPNFQSERSNGFQLGVGYRKMDYERASIICWSDSDAETKPDIASLKPGHHLWQNSEEIGDGSPKSKTGKLKHSSQEDFVKEVIHGNYEDPNHTKVNKSSFGQEIVRIPSFSKDDKYIDTSIPKATKSSVSQKVVRQTSFKDDKYAETSLPIATESSVFADTSPPVTPTGSSVQKVVRQTSFKEDKYKDTTLPTTISRFPHNFVRQTSFSNDGKYTNTSVEQMVVRQASFSKDNKYTDSNHPTDTSKSSVGHTIVEQPKGDTTLEYTIESQAKSTPTAFTNFSSLRQEGQCLLQNSVSGPESINKDNENKELDHIGKMKSFGQVSEGQQRGVHKQDNSYEIHRDIMPDPIKISIGGCGKEATVIPFSNQRKGIHRR